MTLFAFFASLFSIFSALFIRKEANRNPILKTPRRRKKRQKAEELIKLARAAIGGEEVLSKIQTITATGKYNRFLKYVSVQSSKKVEEKQQALPGKMELEFALPDKFRRRITASRLRGFDYSFAQVVNGAEAWRDPPLPPISSNNDRRVIDVGDVERTEFIHATSAKQGLTYYSIAFLLMPRLPG